MSLLEKINEPRDLRSLSTDQLDQLAQEIRAFLIHHVSQTGGHLGPNLGVVELTLALHRVFESPRDPIIFDTGHQSYVHKILTGRRELFPTLKQRYGLSGYPSRAESEHDWVENQHASASLSYADGLAKAFRLRGDNHTVVAVIGDGALTGGMAWEALNNIAASPDLPVVIVVNDNGRSYTPTVGAIADHLSALRTDPRYEQVLDLVRRSVTRTPVVGSAAYEVLHGVKTGLKDVLAPQGMFADLGLKYVGPIDGHDVGAVERALQQAKHFGGPVMVHVITHKGKGFPAAENNAEDQFHTVGKIDEITGAPLSGPGGRQFAEIFGEELVRLGRFDDRLVAITAAMLYPTGLHRFAEVFPERTFDVGIAEQHAVTSAAGLAMGGMHPVFGVYATFLNRAFDQVLLDVALHRLGVTFVLDRAGVTGNDGASHNGMWDLSILQLVPGLQLAAPRDATRLRQALGRAVTIDDAPTVIRYSKEVVPADIDAVDVIGGIDVLARCDHDQVLVVGYGAMVPTALTVGRRLADQGIGATVVDPVWALPVNPALIDCAARHQLVITIEDNGVVGGCGARLAQELSHRKIKTPVRNFGVPQRFLEHGSRSGLLEELGLSAQEIARETLEEIVGHARPLTTEDVLADRPQS
ncbi:1-deoxy-D-xylulose-5-phosphate synthase 1 [Microlunatus endophyticus]|uniref:1-deoxy-D-xylulose-5-phosphate synthase n=1 Tax=Microlunatus endophyticus TaxID=1716077 RepID=A0A917S1Y8_9ACTN|nr:1-deoxy-D-xylulose-5-phosphate synthase [Microlunatus endophyticus]GGL51699.1 1-deoxy-D-xylulose-5-phosphate synthase 1 [Microlunatus endophyticus]